MTTTSYDIIVVGAGPAGLATALHLARQRPDLAARTLVLEAATHPRPKVCGGAITFHGEEQLASLGITVDVPSVSVDRLRFELGRHAIVTDFREALRVIQREEFDNALAQAAQQHGVVIHSGERLLDVQPVPGGMVLQTSQATYRARVVVGADGTKSAVRRRLGMRGPHGVARLLRLMVPVDAGRAREFSERAVVFDFSCLAAGVQGYAWSFPCLVGGQAHLNCGIFDSRISTQPHGDLKAALAAYLDKHGIAAHDTPLEGHPVRWFNPADTFAQPHVVLVGDAAGVDPLFAEGISYALEYGAVAATTIIDAFDRQDWSFADYRARLVNGTIGQSLARRVALAAYLYGRNRMPLTRCGWWLASVAPAYSKRAVGRMLGVLPRAA